LIVEAVLPRAETLRKSKKSGASRRVLDEQGAEVGGLLLEELIIRKRRRTLIRAFEVEFLEE
jgi:hypothetical protein